MSDVALLAYLASPAFSGTPTAPTAAPLTSTTQIATTAFTTLAVGVETTRAEAAESANATAISAETTRAEAAEASLAPLASPTFTGTVVLPSAVNATASSDLIFTAAGTNKVRIATAVGTFDFFGTGGGMSLATQNASMAIDATGNVTIAATTVGGTATTTIQGGAGGIQINSSGKGETQMLGPISINAFTVSTLPVGAEAFVLYAVDGRKVGEGVGAGTGVPVYFSNGLWRVFSTDAQVQA